MIAKVFGHICHTAFVDFASSLHAHVHLESVDLAFLGSCGSPVHCYDAQHGGADDCEDLAAGGDEDFADDELDLLDEPSLNFGTCLASIDF